MLVVETYVKWSHSETRHLGINGNEGKEDQDHRFMPLAHGYDSYLGDPFSNAPMCEMDKDGISKK